MQTRDLSDFGQGPGDERVVIFPSQSSRVPPPLLNETDLDQEVLDEHYRGTQPSDVFVYALDGYTCWSTGLLIRQNEVFLKEDVMPPYIGGQLVDLPAVWVGALRNPEPRLISHDGPLAVALHPNMVYGHFLLEMLPRIYLLGVLQNLGFDVPLLLQESLPPWIRGFVKLYFSPDRIISYDWQNDAVVAPKFIVPSMMHTHFAYHPAFNLMVDDVLRRSGITPAKTAVNQGRRIYLSRVRHSHGWHLMENEAAVEGMMANLGFEIIHPQTLPLQEQLAIYASSSVIVGQFSSALHNALFAPFGTIVVALNRVNWYQSSIARLRRQRLAYVRPSDGCFRDYRTRSDEQVRFQIDVPELEKFLRHLL